MGIRKTAYDNFLPEVAANGLIDRRALLGRGVLIAGAMGTGVSASPIRAAADPLPVDAWSLEIGSAIPSRAPAKRARHTICSMAPLPPTGCISWCRAPGSQTSIRTSTG